MSPLLSWLIIVAFLTTITVLIVRRGNAIARDIDCVLDDALGCRADVRPRVDPGCTCPQCNDARELVLLDAWWADRLHQARVRSGR